MKVCIVVAMMVAAAVGEAPAPAAPILRPSGRIILLPTNVETPIPESQPQAQQQEEAKAALIDSGEYYVLLPDGRLQMVKYSTLPLTDNADSATTSQQVKEEEPKPTSAPLYQVKYVQFPLPGSQEFTQSRLELAPVSTPQQVSQKKEEEKESVSGFQANLQYREVKPISAPVYAYNPSPLVRVLRK